MTFYDRRAPQSEIGKIARGVGLTYSFLWRVLRGNARLSLHTATRLAQHLGVNIDDLEGWIAQKRIELWPDSPDKNTGAGHAS